MEGKRDMSPITSSPQQIKKARVEIEGPQFATPPHNYLTWYYRTRGVPPSHQDNANAPLEFDVDEQAALSC